MKLWKLYHHSLKPAFTQTRCLLKNYNDFSMTYNLNHLMQNRFSQFCVQILNKHIQQRARLNLSPLNWSGICMLIFLCSLFTYCIFIRITAVFLFLIFNRWVVRRICVAKKRSRTLHIKAPVLAVFQCHLFSLDEATQRDTSYAGLWLTSLPSLSTKSTSTHSTHTQAPLIYLFIWMKWNIYKPLTALTYSLNKKHSLFIYTNLTLNERRKKKHKRNVCTFSDVFWDFSRSQNCERALAAPSKIFLTLQFKENSQALSSMRTEVTHLSKYLFLEHINTSVLDKLNFIWTFLL